MSILDVRNLRKSFDGELILDDVSFSLEEGECLCILGNSGSGKSTALRCVNLLTRPDAGDIVFEGKSILAPGVNENLVRSKMTMVFQQFNLFNNLNVLDNCTLAQIKVLHKSKQEAEAKAIEELEKVGLKDFIYAHPATLSGGQKRLLAIACALVIEPEVLLLDELSNFITTFEILSMLFFSCLIHIFFNIL